MYGSSYIERGSDGRPQYVRPFVEFPSVRKLFTDALRDLRAQSRKSFKKASSEGQLNNPEERSRVQNPDARSWTLLPIMDKYRQPTVRSGNSQLTSGNVAISPTPKPYDGSQPPRFPTFPPFMSMVHGNSNLLVPPWAHPQNTPPMSVLGPMQFPMAAPMQRPVPCYMAPHPRMYPFVPAGMQAIGIPSYNQESSGPFTNTGHALLAPEIPSSAVPDDGVTRPAQPASTHTRFRVDKHGVVLCSTCGQPRSGRFQWHFQKHKGQPFNSSICRRCREIETSGEEDASADESRNSKYPHGRSARRGKRSASRPTQKLIGHENSDSDIPTNVEIMPSTSRTVRQTNHKIRTTCQNRSNSDNGYASDIERAFSKRSTYKNNQSRRSQNLDRYATPYDPDHTGYPDTYESAGLRKGRDGHRPSGNIDTDKRVAARSEWLPPASTPADPYMDRANPTVTYVDGPARDNVIVVEEDLYQKCLAPKHGASKDHADELGARRISHCVDDHDWYDRNGIRIRVQEI